MFWHMGPPGVGCLLGLILFGVAGTVFWIWALIDCATKEPNEGSSKVMWILIILITHFLGALLYVLIRRPERLQLVGR